MRWMPYGGPDGSRAGTHALIKQAVDFHDLGLVVTDEQHVRR